MLGYIDLSGGLNEIFGKRTSDKQQSTNKAHNIQLDFEKLLQEMYKYRGTTWNIEELFPITTDHDKWAKILKDTEVQYYLTKSYASYLAQQDSLYDKHPYKEEELAHYKRTLTPTKDKSSLNDDMLEFYNYNAKLKGSLDSILADDNIRPNDNIKQGKADFKKISLNDKRHYVQKIWTQNIEAKKSEWINLAKDKLSADYKQRIQDYLESLLEMQAMLKDLGEAGELFSGDLEALKQSLDVANLGDEKYLKNINAGGGFDNSLGNKNYTDINTIKRYLQTLRDSKALREIADILGKLKKAEEESEIEKIKELKSYSYTQIIPTKRYKEEICGVTLGSDLENLLPQELAMLGDSDLELLFDLKYIQKRLFCFEKHGYQAIMQEAQEEIEKEKEKKKEKEKNQGAMIICVDTSSSMSGEPEHIAKAIAIYLATKAQTQKRACYLINFSTSIETMELSGKGGLSRLISFLMMSFHGGTDVSPALHHGLNKMQSESFRQSDLIAISDGCFGHISNTLIQQMQAQRQKKNKFYLLDIAGSSGAKEFFDIHWQYNTHSKNVQVLHKIANG